MAHVLSKCLNPKPQLQLANRGNMCVILKVMAAFGDGLYYGTSHLPLYPQMPHCADEYFQRRLEEIPCYSVVLGNPDPNVRPYCALFLHQNKQSVKQEEKSWEAYSVSF